MRTTKTIRLPAEIIYTLQTTADAYEMSISGAISFIYARAAEADQLRETVNEQSKTINNMEAKAAKNRHTLNVIMSAIDSLDKSHPARQWFAQNVLPKLEGEQK